MHFCLLCQAKQEAIPADFDFDNSSNEPSGGLFNFLDFFIGDNLRGGLFRGWHVKICLVVGHIPIGMSVENYFFDYANAHNHILNEYKFSLIYASFFFSLKQ